MLILAKELRKWRYNLVAKKGKEMIKLSILLIIIGILMIFISLVGLMNNNSRRF